MEDCEPHENAVNDCKPPKNPPRDSDCPNVGNLNLSIHLQVKYEKAKEPPGPKMTRTEIYEILLSQQGCKCEGCDRVFDDRRYLQLDHNTPRADEGINHISNRVLL